MKRQTVTGLTVVMHGYQFTDSDGGSLMPLAVDMFNAIPGFGWLLFYELYEDGDQAAFDADRSVNVPAPNASGQQGHLVLLFSWAPESNEDDSGWAEAAGDALFALLVSLGLANPENGSGVPMHFIAHSFGTGVVSECVERLAKYQITVDQVTYLDAHDFDQSWVPIDGSQRIWTLGQPKDYGATIWNNVVFADSYYQTRGVAGRAIVITLPNGRPIPGCYNYFVSDELPPPSQWFPPWNPYGNSSESDHSWIWKVFYRGSILGELPPDSSNIAAPQQMPDWTSFGWAFCRFNPNRINLPEPIFFNAAPPAVPTQDHIYSVRQIANENGTPNTVGLTQLGLTAAQVTRGKWTPLWNPNQLYNGRFDHDGRTLVGGGSVIPGWSHHGGGGTGYVSSQGGNNFLKLNIDYHTRTHNRVYIPKGVNRLKFRMFRRSTNQFNTLDVFIGDRNNGLLAVIPLNRTDGGWVTKYLTIHPHLRDKVNTITFEIYRHQFTPHEVWIDDVEFDDSLLLGEGLGKVRATNALAGVNQVENPLEWSRRDYTDFSTQEIFGYYPNYSVSNPASDAFGIFPAPHTIVNVPVSGTLQAQGWPQVLPVPRSLYRTAGSYTNNSLSGNHFVIGSTWIKYELDSTDNRSPSVAVIKVLPWRIRDVIQFARSDVNAPSQIDFYVAQEDPFIEDSPETSLDWLYVGSVSTNDGTILNVCSWDASNTNFGIVPDSTYNYLSGMNDDGVRFWDDPNHDLWHSVLRVPGSPRAKYVALVFPAGNQFGADLMLSANNNTSTSLRFTDLSDIKVFARVDRNPGDADENGCVNDADLLIVLFAFGTEGPEGDVNYDGSVDDIDLLEVLYHYGEGCEL
ncbi:MAG: hypothetical protein KIT45_08485 [Fimbriimonadia bacterium]|nr:hypothetical protein [Fimbriimonadia bacterium]